MNTAERDSRRVLKNGGMGGPTLSGSSREPDAVGVEPSQLAIAACERSSRSHQRDQRTGAEAFADQVREIWRSHHGLGNPWPRERRDDAIQIGKAIRRHHLPLAFWQALIASVPLGATMRYLTTRGRYGSSRLQDAVEAWQESAGAARYIPPSAVTSHILGGLLKRISASSRSNLAKCS